MKIALHYLHCWKFIIYFRTNSFSTMKIFLAVQRKNKEIIHNCWPLCAVVAVFHAFWCFYVFFWVENMRIINIYKFLDISIKLFSSVDAVVVEFKEIKAKANSVLLLWGRHILIIMFNDCGFCYETDLS